MKQNYLEIKKVLDYVCLPLEGNIDLTYRCNNSCRHCWLSIPASAKEKENELSLSDIKKIVTDAKNMGCRKWSISGGEPMLREDFEEIFTYITANSISYTINTNGTLITPRIAKLLKKKGVKMVALYGATAEVHDNITRNPGSFEATMRGFNYLKEAGAGFIVQLIPMKDNYHQFKQMVALAESLSKTYRVGAAWLYLSACGDQRRNQEIIQQRLSPQDVVDLDKPDLSYEEALVKISKDGCHGVKNGQYLFSSCVAKRRDFHVDPYGLVTFCCFIKDEALRYDLKKGNFQDYWNNFFPSLAKKVEVTQEYRENCGSCELRKDCRACPVYGYLEHRSFGAKVDYLCAVAKENRRFKEEWQKNHRRYFRIADITVRVDSDLEINDQTFHAKFDKFRVDGPSEDMIYLKHHFSLPDINGRDLGQLLYRKPPWAVYKNKESWIYLGISPIEDDKQLHRVAVFNQDHSSARIYNDKEESFLKGGMHSLTLFPTDQILLARILADRQGCFIHSCGVNLEGKGLLFAGHSEAGKSTMATMLKGKAEILCDDRIIVRSYPEGFKIYGTWSHGDVPDVSASCAPLTGILFLEKAKENRLIRIEDKKETTRRLLSCLIKPFVTVDWWDKTLSLIDKIAREAPCYILRFDKSGMVVDLLKQL